MKNDENFHAFRILDEVSRNGEVTQRSLSRRLGVALGLTNLYVRRLAQKGFIKVVNIKPNRLRYELTPSGIAQKTTLAFQYIKDSYVFYREVRKTLTKTFEALRASGARSVVLYGTGDIAEIALLSLQETDLNLAGIVSKRHAGQTLCGRPVHPPEALTALTCDRVLVLEREAEEAIKILGDLGVGGSKIVRVGS